MCRQEINNTQAFFNAIIPPHLQDWRLKNAYEKALFKNKANSSAEFLWSILNNIHSETAEHSRRVSEVSGFFGEFLGLEKAEVEDIKIVGLLHDIGKIDPWYYPNGNKTNREHANIGAEIAKRLGFSETIVTGIRYHHERRDGTGLNRKKAPEIPKVVAIIRYVDIFDRIVSQQKSILHRSDNNSSDYDFEELSKKAWQKINKLGNNKLDPQFLSQFGEFLEKNSKELIGIYSQLIKKLTKQSIKS